MRFMVIVKSNRDSEAGVLPSKEMLTEMGKFNEELVAGYWMWRCKSLDEAIDWLKRAPFEDTEVEIRQVFEAEDFGDNLTPEVREQEERLRSQVAAKQ